MKPDNPQSFKTFADVLKWAKSVYKALASGLSLATPTTKDATGVYNNWNPDVINGVMIRVGATATTVNTYKWSAGVGAGSATIKHGLIAQPTGFIVCDKDKTCDVFRSGAPTTSSITLTCSDNTANVTVFIF